MLKVSIVLPFYNAEEYLSRCIDSIMSQTYPNYELLLINDGSTDKSSEIAYNYKQKDERIQVIDKENTGVSDSRNYGIKNATGKYLFFIDADDWIESDALELLVKELEKTKCDWSTCAIWKEYSDRKKFSAGHRSGIINRDEALISLYNDGYIRPVVWGKLYRLDWIRKNEVYFNTKIHYSEDVLFLTKVLLFSQNIAYVEKPLYHYFVDNMNSALHRWNGRKFNPKALSKWEAYIEMKNLLEAEFSVESIVYQEFVAHMVEVAREMLHLCVKNKFSNGEYYQEKRKFIRKNLFIYWKIRKKGLKKKIAIFLSAFSPKVEYKIMNMK